MKKIRKRILCAALTLVLALTLCPSAMAAAEESNTIQLGDNCVVFSDISQMAAGECMQHTVRQGDRSEAIVGIERMPQFNRAGGEVWRVWYNAIGVDVEFYMTVSNNRVTSAYDYSISLFAASYEDAKLTHTSTYGKLSFTGKGFGGLTTATCWLKGTVTGVDDQIEVTWQM